MRNVSITYNSSDEYKRDRKILLNKRELIKIQKELDKGLTIVPYRVYTNERDRLKVEIVICRGKKLYDKRDTIKKRDIEREVKRNLK
jgi:SsrA-binding protein